MENARNAEVEERLLVSDGWGGGGLACRREPVDEEVLRLLSDAIGSSARSASANSEGNTAPTMTLQADNDKCRLLAIDDKRAHNESERIRHLPLSMFTAHDANTPS